MEVQCRRCGKKFSLKEAPRYATKSVFVLCDGCFSSLVPVVTEKGQILFIEGWVKAK